MTSTPNRRRAIALIAKMGGSIIDAADTIKPSEIVLRLTGEIGHKGPISATRIRAALSRHPKAPLRVLLDSSGGSVRESETIATLIRNHQATTMATVTGQCMSAAVIILVACDIRDCAKDAEFLLHPAALAPDLPGRWTASQHRAAALIVERSTKRMVAFVARRTGSSEQRVAKACIGEKSIDAYAAAGLGLVQGFVQDRQIRAGRAYYWPIERSRNAAR